MSEENLNDCRDLMMPVYSLIEPRGHLCLENLMIDQRKVLDHKHINYYICKQIHLDND